MSSDEFDAIPDEFENIQGIDWATLLSQSTPTSTSTRSNSTGLSTTDSHYSVIHDDSIRVLPYTGPQSRSSEYFSDGGSLDVAFLTELDRVERRVLFSSDAAPSAPAGLHARLPDSEGLRNSRANLQPVEPCIEKSPRNEKEKPNVLEDILATYEAELICPICCDLLVAAHVGNPCGHSFCGECGWQWHVKKKREDCPCCRQSFNKLTPMIPNIAIDNTVEQHVKALATSGAVGWESGGSKNMDWISRKKSRQLETQKRGKPQDRSLIPIELIDPPVGWVQIGPLQDTSDGDFIPRPIRRARRRQPGPTSGTVYGVG